MKVKNKRSTAVVVAAAGSAEPIVAEPGETIEVDDDLGKSLCKQVDRWEPVGSQKTSAASGGKERES